MSLRDEMPLLARHEGEWVGTYIYIDAEGKILDRHSSHLTCRFPDADLNAYHQTNRYTWDDGRTEEHQFPATYRDGKIWFDTERIRGYAWEVDDKTLMLTWHYRREPEKYLYEMIQLSSDGHHRARTWHWFDENGEIYKRTIIKEERVRK